MVTDKILLITQARTGSSRLPGKVLREVLGKSLLEIHLRRLENAKMISEIIVATTTKREDDKLYDLVGRLGFKSYRGSENDVLDRFYQAAKSFKPKWIVRVTSDCPLIDPVLVDKIINHTVDSEYDYISNALSPTYPDGQDVEVFKFEALQLAWEKAAKGSEREHVTPFIRNNSNGSGENLFRSSNFSGDEDFSRIRMTVDEEPDFLLVKSLIESLGIDKDWKTYTDFILKQDLMSINSHIIRNEGYQKSLKND